MNRHTMKSQVATGIPSTYRNHPHCRKSVSSQAEIQ